LFVSGIASYFFKRSVALYHIDSLSMNWRRDAARTRRRGRLRYTMRNWFRWILIGVIVNGSVLHNAATQMHRVDEGVRRIRVEMVNLSQGPPFLLAARPIGSHPLAKGGLVHQVHEETQMLWNSLRNERIRVWYALRLVCDAAALLSIRRDE
jgi:hypothetical protein